MSRRQEQTFGDYTLIERIARGGMAEIFLARTRGFRGFEKTLVIKRLHEHYSSDAEFVHMLVDEAKITVQLQHANIVQIFDLGHVDGQYYIAMEFIDGLDLFRVLRELHDRDLLMPIAAAAHITAELCHGLHYAHTRRDSTTGEPLAVIHRDISPQNVLLSWAGEVKLADFGIVKAAQRSTHTQAGIIKGKFYYMSPEQALGQTLDRRSDIFSAGIVLYEALTARPLYDDGEDADLLKRVQLARITSPRELREDIPPELEAICMKALAPERDQRYSSALELARDLNEFVVGQGRSFTKVDLAEFMGSLFAEPEEAARPEAPAEPGPPPIPAAAQGADSEELVIMEGIAPPDDVLDPGATVALPLSALTGTPVRGADAITAETPGPMFAPPASRHEQPTMGAKPSTRPSRGDASPAAPVVEPPVTSTREPRAEPRVDQTALVSRASIARAPRPAPSASAPESTVAEARTTRLSLDEIRLQDAQIRARLGAVQPTTTEVETSREEPGWARRRDRALKAALLVVLVAIMFVGAAIVWLLANPVVPTSPSAPAAASRSESKPPPKTGAAPSVKAPTVGRPPAAATTRTGRVVLSTAPNVRSYRLYVDGELTDTVNGEVRLPVGRHTIAARLQPQGRMTNQRVVRVEPGGVIRLLLE